MNKNIKTHTVFNLKYYERLNVCYLLIKAIKYDLI